MNRLEQMMMETLVRELPRITKELAKLNGDKNTLGDKINKKFTPEEFSTTLGKLLHGERFDETDWEFVVSLYDLTSFLVAKKRRKEDEYVKD